jgi:hypothetical protein
MPLWIVLDVLDATFLLRVKLGFHVNVALSGQDQCALVAYIRGDGFGCDSSHGSYDEQIRQRLIA